MSHLRFLAAAGAAFLCAVPPARADAAAAPGPDPMAQRNRVSTWSSAPGDPGLNTIDANALARGFGAVPPAVIRPGVTKLARTIEAMRD